MSTQRKPAADRKIVFKYELSKGITELVLPSYARILSVQFRRGKIILWAMVNEDQAGTEKRRFLVVGTAIPIDEPDIVHISTIQSECTDCVWHVFEID